MFYLTRAYYFRSDILQHIWDIGSMSAIVLMKTKHCGLRSFHHRLAKPIIYWAGAISITGCLQSTVSLIFEVVSATWYASHTLQCSRLIFQGHHRHQGSYEMKGTLY